MPKTNKYYEQTQFIKNDKIYLEHSKNEDFVSGINKIQQYRGIDSLNRRERRSVILTFDSIVDVIYNYQLDNVHLARRGSHCDLCGTFIYHVFTIKNDHTKKTLNLGSECIINHKIRVKGYDTAEEIANYIEGEKHRLSNMHRDILWKTSTEYKRDDLGRWLLGLASKYSRKVLLPSDYRYFGKETDVIQKIIDGYRTDDKTWGDIERSDKKEAEALMSKIKSEISQIKFSKIYTLKIPVGKSNVVSVDVNIENFKVTADSFTRIINAKKFNVRYASDISCAIGNALYKNKDTLSISEISPYKTKIKMALMNEKSILQFVNDYCSYMIKVQEIYDKYRAEADAIINPPIPKAIPIDSNEDPIVSLIMSKKINDNVRGIILNKEYKGFRHEITNTTNNAVLITETDSKNESKKFWIPKSKIYFDKENNFILLAKWIITANNINGVV